jgi:hypothetical protein
MRRFMILPLLACLLLGLSPRVFAQEEQPGKSEEDNGYAQISIFAKALELIGRITWMRTRRATMISSTRR